MIKFWAESERFISSVNNKQEVIIVKEDVFKELNIDIFQTSNSSRTFEFPFFMPCMDFVLKSRVIRAVKKAKELYDITTNNSEQIFTLKSY